MRLYLQDRYNGNEMYLLCIYIKKQSFALVYPMHSWIVAGQGGCQKCGYIEKLSAIGIVLSEVGSKDAAHIIPPYKWIELMRAELQAGATYVIAEAREAGNVGIYRGSGEVREGLVQEILTQIPGEKILWEAPQKEQQLYFIELLGPNVNLGNIAPSEIIALETMRIGLRGDTFELFLDK